MKITPYRFNYVRNTCAPILIWDNYQQQIWRVSKDGHFQTYWYSLSPGADVTTEGDPPHIDVRTLPTHDETRDRTIVDRLLKAPMDTPASTRAINDHRYYHAQCFAAAISDGIDLASFARTERQKLHTTAKLERATQKAKKQ